MAGAGSFTPIAKVAATFLFYELLSAFLRAGGYVAVGFLPPEV
jgi:hypothetical protein